MVLGYHIFAAVHKFFEVNVLGGCLKTKVRGSGFIVRAAFLINAVLLKCKQVTERYTIRTSGRKKLGQHLKRSPTLYTWSHATRTI